MRNINRRVFVQAAGLGATAMFVAGGAGRSAFADDKPIVLRLSHAIGRDTARQRGAELFAKRVNELTNGQVTVEIYSDSQIGSESQSLEGLQTGTIDLGIITIYSNVLTVAKVFDLPFLFRDLDHWSAALNGEPGKMASASATGTGMKVLGYWFAGWRNIYGNREVKTVKDLVGLKLRTQQTPAFVELFKDAGAIPTPIAWTETYMALQQRTVDAAETGFSSMYDQKQYEVAKYGTFSRHAAGATAFLVSQAKWDVLPDTVREAIITAQDEARISQDKEMFAREDLIVGKLKELGMTFSDLDTTELRKIAVEKVYPSVITSDDQKELLAAVQKM